MKLSRYIFIQLILLILLPFYALGKELSLKECLSAVMTKNPALSEIRLNVAADEQGIISAKGKHFPRIVFDANIIKRQDPIPYIPAQSPQIGPHYSDSYSSWTLMLTIPVYQGGQISAGVDLARLRTQLQENSLTLTKNDLIANNVNTYNKLLQTRKLKEALQASVQALEKQRKNAQLLFDVGRIAKVDLLKIEVQLANEKQRLLSLEEAKRRLTVTLRFLMGQEPDALPAVLTPPIR